MICSPYSRDLPRSMHKKKPRSIPGLYFGWKNRLINPANSRAFFDLLSKKLLSPCLALCIFKSPFSICILHASYYASTPPLLNYTVMIEYTVLPSPRNFLSAYCVDPEPSRNAISECAATDLLFYGRPKFRSSA